MRAWAVLAMGFMMLAGNAMASVVVAPTRVIVAPGVRATEMSLFNDSEKPFRYNMSLGDMEMGPSGSLVLTSGTMPYSAKPMLRFMPKVIDLKPGERQIVRIVITRPSGLEDGDYHTHIFFKQVVVPVKTSPTERIERGFKTNIGMLYSVVVPIVVQQGKISSTLVVEGARREAPDKVIISMKRLGNAEAERTMVLEQDGKHIAPPQKVRVYREMDHLELPKLVKGADFNKPMQLRLLGATRSAPDQVIDVK